MTTKPSETASAADGVRKSDAGDTPETGDRSAAGANDDGSSAPDYKAAIAKVRAVVPRPSAKHEPKRMPARTEPRPPPKPDTPVEPVRPSDTTIDEQAPDKAPDPEDTTPKADAAPVSVGDADQDKGLSQTAELPPADSDDGDAAGAETTPDLVDDIEASIASELSKSREAEPAADAAATDEEPEAEDAPADKAAKDQGGLADAATEPTADEAAPKLLPAPPPTQLPAPAGRRKVEKRKPAKRRARDAAKPAASQPTTPRPAPPRRRNWPLWARLVAFVAGVPLLIVAILYGVLLIGPVSLSFARPGVEEMIRDSLPPGSRIELGELTLSLSARFRPVLRFTPVAFTDTSSGAEVSLDALEIGVSPLQTLIGQPGAVVSLIGPQLQIVQDLLGPRLASFAPREDLPSGRTLYEIRQGSDVYPEVYIRPEGLKVSGPSPSGDGIGIRSDNDWLIHNFENMEHAINDLESQARGGQFARLEIRQGSFEMLDPVYGKLRRFDDLTVVLTPGTRGRPTRGKINATLANRAVSGSFEHRVGEDGRATLSFGMENLDFASLISALDDPDGLMAIKGVGTLNGAINYSRAGGDVLHGRFEADLAGTQFRLRNDMFPVSRAEFALDWEPENSRFEISEGAIAVGDSSAAFNGEIVFGLNDYYGPVFSAGLTLSDFTLAPYDLPAPSEPFDQVDMRVWAAPLYGAIGLDRVVATKPGVEIRAKGRFDTIRSGIGLSLEVGGEGASADDLKRLWPYFIAPGGREWLVEHITTGRVETGSLRFDLPVGTIDMDGEDKPLPPNSGRVDLVASDVTVIPTEGFSPMALGGKVKLSMRDNKTLASLGTTQIVGDGGQFSVNDLAVEIDGGTIGETVLGFSGDVSGDIPALIGFAENEAPGMIAGLDLPFDARSLKGTVDGKAVVTMLFGEDPAPKTIDYAVNGSASDFSSDAKIADRMISNGQLSFRATPVDYVVTGDAELDGVPAQIELAGGGDAPAEITVSSTIDVEEFAKFGFDVSDLVSGSIRFAAKPLEDGALQLTADLAETRVDIKDLGIAKPARVPGMLNAELRQDGTSTKISKIDLSFANVRLKGEVEFDAESGLVTADFSDFALSAGDSARLSVRPGESGGFDVELVGEQFDLKPMLRRYFALDQPSTGSPQATSVEQRIGITARLKRALGFFSTTAYNVELGLDLRGENLLNASLQGQFAEGNSVSLTTNPTSGGRLMTIAFNDAGTLLRFLNVYPRLLGGSGSLTLRTDAREKVDYGEIRIRDFSIVDEEKVAQIVGNHQDSRQMIADQNSLTFQDGRASFIRRSDRIELIDGVLDGGSIGGTLQGFVYTKARKYDLTGTYIPLFGLNNMFRQLPLIGELLGGRTGEGLVGVTFAVRGDLDDPQFIVNPVSILAPGVFRSIFEFRATEAPREGETAQ